MSAVKLPNTPLIELILSIVRATCEPRREGWADLLHARLWAELYGPVLPGSEIRAIDFEIQQARNRAVEKRIMESPIRPAATVEAS